ncbi:uncharacterized protein BX663DRAFT_77136 [Cokeromyces recurvatus]|uniref:uncharacterized protein n=1 Tax=Cokeromyces recurvatus TaxID=90255 RepID=UPI0022204E59|nr:uncharacterized protein BX663DRAFT_77136 [Cokeromyces recurvatus]KAI7902498.1 hypothetical protein BX663DRAFT_77136 [Cokeromyces recurvatus]
MYVLFFFCYSINILLFPSLSSLIYTYICMYIYYIPDFSVDCINPFFLNTKLLPINIPIFKIIIKKRLMRNIHSPSIELTLPLAIAKVTPIILYKAP